MIVLRKSWIFETIWSKCFASRFPENISVFWMLRSSSRFSIFNATEHSLSWEFPETRFVPELEETVLMTQHTKFSTGYPGQGVMALSYKHLFSGKWGYTNESFLSGKFQREDESGEIAGLSFSYRDSRYCDIGADGSSWTGSRMQIRAKKRTHRFERERITGSKRNFGRGWKSLLDRGEGNGERFNANRPRVLSSSVVRAINGIGRN